MENSQKSFEDLMKELETVVENLENRDIPLDTAVKEYTKGLELSKKCYEILEKNQKLVSEKMTEQGLVAFSDEETK